MTVAAGGCATQQHYSDNTQYLHESNNEATSRSNRQGMAAEHHHREHSNNELPHSIERKHMATENTPKPEPAKKVERPIPAPGDKVNLEGDDVKLEGNK